jgi:serine/threonine protein phosphatase PrpC
MRFESPNPAARHAPGERVSARPTTRTASITGRREANEDAVLADDALRLYAVADGLGGRPGGATASRVALGAFWGAARALLFTESAVVSDLYADLATRGRPEALLEHAARCAHRAVRRGQLGPLAEMGTTLAALHFAEGAALVAHVGDSRVYRLRGGELAPLTEDHSLIGELTALGTVLTAAQRDAYAHVVTRALGVRGEAEPTVRRVDVAPGDVFLLCTDGLHGALPDARIAALLRESLHERAAEQLVWEAFAAGSEDNVSAVVVRAPV